MEFFPQHHLFMERKSHAPLRSVLNFTWKKLGGLVGDPDSGEESLNMLAVEEMPAHNNHRLIRHTLDRGLFFCSPHFSHQLTLQTLFNYYLILQKYGKYGTGTQASKPFSNLGWIRIRLKVGLRK
jgi:hypothetical protein